MISLCVCVCVCVCVCMCVCVCVSMFMRYVFNSCGCLVKTTFIKVLEIDIKTNINKLLPNYFRNSFV